MIRLTHRAQKRLRKSLNLSPRKSMTSRLPSLLKPCHHLFRDYYALRLPNPRTSHQSLVEAMLMVGGL